MNGKFLTTAALAATLVASNAFATVARVSAFGTQPVTTTLGTSAEVVSPATGSLWYDDAYNVFYNPALVMDNKNYVTIEKAREAGFFKGEFDNFAYGVYVNRGGGTANVQYAPGLVAPGVASNAGYGTGSVSTQRPIDLFIAGDHGVKWGFHVAWAYNRDESTGNTVANTTSTSRNGEDRSARYWHFDLGAQVMGLEPFVGMTLFSKAQNGLNAGGTIEQELNEFNIGTRYKYEGWTPYVTFRKMREGAGQNNTVSPRAVQTRVNQFGFGVSHDTKVADGVHVIKNIGLWMNSVEDDTGATELAKDFKDTIVPINVALEAEATSWLTLRAGASYDFINTRKFARSNATATASVNDKLVSQAGNTTIRIGSTMKFGKLGVDSVFGTGAGAVAVNADNLDRANAGFDSQTFAQLSATYRW